MPLLNVRDSNQGFTLIESLVVIAMVGIISAIAVPNLLSMVNRSRVNSAQADIQGVLQEAQRQAIRNSRSCYMTLNNNSVTGDCLVTGDLTLNGFSIRSSVSEFRFNHRGELSDSNTPPQPLEDPITIVLSTADSNVQQCLVLSVPLGVLRSGTYTTVSSASSTTTEDTVPPGTESLPTEPTNSEANVIEAENCTTQL